MLDITELNYQDHWEEIEINFDRSQSHKQSLGFIIAGGIDGSFNQCNFPFIIVTHIHKNSLADRNKQLKVHDIILSVNDKDFTKIKFQEAIDTLQSSGRIVNLIVRRLSPKLCEDIELKQNGKLGICIGGGMENECFKDDHGIFVTKINTSDASKQLAVGDRLLEISSKSNTYDLRFVTFEDAKRNIRLACVESETIKLTVAHIKPIEQVQNDKNVLPEQNDDPLDSQHEESVNVENENALIMPFDFDDYQRYENRLPYRAMNRTTDLLKVEEQPNTINRRTMSGTNRITIIERVDTTISNSNEVVIPQRENLRPGQNEISQRANTNTNGVTLNENGSLRWQVD